MLETSLDVKSFLQGRHPVIVLAMRSVSFACALGSWTSWSGVSTWTRRTREEIEYRESLLGLM